MNRPQQASNESLPRQLIALPVASLLVVAVWSGANGETGDPTLSAHLLLLAAPVALALSQLTVHRIPALVTNTPHRLAMLALAGVAPLLMSAAANLIGAIHVAGLPADLVLALLWGVALAAPCGVMIHLCAPSARLGAIGALLGAGIASQTGHFLSAGAFPFLLSATGVALLAPPLMAPPPLRPDRSVHPAATAAAAAVLACWILAVPPLLGSYGGDVPQGPVFLLIALLIGIGAGKLPSFPVPAWIPAALAGISGLTVLAILPHHLWVAGLTENPSFGELGPVAPWIALATTAIPLGLGWSLWPAGPCVHKPWAVLAGVLLGMGAIGVATGRGSMDLPVRITVAVAVLAGSLALVQSVTTGRRWLSAIGGVVLLGILTGAGMFAPCPEGPVALDSAARFARLDITLQGDLHEAETLRSGVDRAGPRCVVATATGTYMHRARYSLAPSSSESASESMLALLPLLAHGEPREATLVGLGRGDALVALHAAGLHRIQVIDSSTHAGKQVAAANEAVRELLADPDIWFDHRRPRPVLPVPRGSRDILLVNLPPAHVQGAAAWYDGELARDVARALKPMGWGAFRIPTLTMTAQDLAGAVVAIGQALPGATVWVDPLGNGDVIVLGSPSGKPPEAMMVHFSMQQLASRELLTLTNIRSSYDLFTRAFCSAKIPELLDAARPTLGISWRTSEARLTGRRGVPLLEYALAAQPMQELVDVSRLGDEEQQRLFASTTPVYWLIYLQFLDSLSRGEILESPQWIDQLRELSEDPTRDLAPLIRQTVEAGRTAYLRGKPEEAEALFLIAHSFSPLDPDANVELGRIAWDRQDFNVAVDRFTTALERDPTNHVALIGAADCQMRLERPDEAMVLLERCVAVHPESPEALYNLGRLYLDQGQPDAGLEYLWRAAPLAHESSLVHFSIAEAHFMLAIGEQTSGGDPSAHLMQSGEAANRSLVLERSARTLCLAGQVELMRSNFAAAEPLLEESIRDEPQSFDCRAALGETYFAQSKFRLAAQQFKRAQEVRPGDPRVEKRLNQLQSLMPGG